jgi:hypothetical protein
MKNIYISAIKYELGRYDGIEKICTALGKPDASLPESTAWCWFERYENDIVAIKDMLCKIGYEI